MEGFELAILFTAAGAVVGAGLIKVLVSAIKSWGLLPEHGRGVLVAVALLALLLVGLATLDAAFIQDGISAQDVLIVVLAWANLYTASIGVHETAVKAQNIVQGTTNPAGPDAG